MSANLKAFHLEANDPAKDLTFYEVLKPYTVGSFDKLFNEWYYRLAVPGQFIVVDSFFNISILNADQVKRVLNERNRE
jgi:hypothetical protein